VQFFCLFVYPKASALLFIINIARISVLVSISTLWEEKQRVGQTDPLSPSSHRTTTRTYISVITPIAKRGSLTHLYV